MLNRNSIRRIGTRVNNGRVGNIHIAVLCDRVDVLHLGIYKDTYKGHKRIEFHDRQYARGQNSLTYLILSRITRHFSTIDL